MFTVGHGEAHVLRQLFFRRLQRILCRIHAHAAYVHAAHGYARVAALYDASERQVSTVGAYAMTDGEAYMARGETAAELRGRGIGGWLIAEFANRLSAEGWRVAFLCEQKRCHFYDRLGFARAGTLAVYTDLPAGTEKQ